MENKTKKSELDKTKEVGITRLEAIEKTGKYAAITAAAMFVVLSPLKAQPSSGPPTPGGGIGW